MSHIDMLQLRDIPRYVLALFGIVLFFSGVVVGAVIVHQARVENIGTIKVIGVQVYQDETLTSILTSIGWGVLEPGENKSYAAWVLNTGNFPQKLAMWTENWVPSEASAWISLSWDYADAWVQVNASIPVVFTLHVDQGITGIESFSFDIWLKGVS